MISSRQRSGAQFAHSLRVSLLCVRSHARCAPSLVDSGTDTDRAFDAAVGALEEMLLDPEFTSFQSAFLSRHCSEFDAGAENKLSYTPIFDAYVSSMESFIRGYLSRKVSGFSMESFLAECEARGEEQLCGDAFDVLSSMSEFEAFKELMIAHKEQTNWQQLTQQQQQQQQQSGVSGSGTAAAAAAAQSSSSAPSQP